MDGHFLREYAVLDSSGHLTRGGALLFSNLHPFAADPTIQCLRRRTPAGPLTRPSSVHRTPLIVALTDLLRNIDAINETTSVTLPTGVQQQLETTPGPAAREAVVNAIAHRDHRHPEPVRACSSARPTRRPADRPSGTKPGRRFHNAAAAADETEGCGSL
ncbi:hypothetical protein [Frankia sp. Cj5]|uniref:hypothetical protein n=1 Tax=Frankia sp. Cj5 TaxID=2880978 RepID=UPI001EF713A5|nr:hypothetical protein [Frankia sp. Cj5]